MLTSKTVAISFIIERDIRRVSLTAEKEVDTKNEHASILSALLLYYNDDDDKIYFGAFILIIKSEQIIVLD